MLLPSAKSMPDLIGNTPLLHLKQVSELTGCTILGKAEFLNPGGSVKDRTALGIIRDAEKKGTLKPGGTIVEGTAGNTGIGLTLMHWAIAAWLSCLTAKAAKKLNYSIYTAPICA